MDARVMLLLVLAALPGMGAAAQAAGPDDPATPVRQAVLDIISFTRWPEPRQTLRLCVVGQAELAGALFDAPLQAGAVPIQPTRMATTDDRLGTSCDVVYIGPLLTIEREAVARRVAGHPVLTVGEPAFGCIDTTMFCLRVRATAVSFATNLDAIARSGVRLDPRVLLLGRRQSEPGR